MSGCQNTLLHCYSYLLSRENAASEFLCTDRDQEWPELRGGPCGSLRWMLGLKPLFQAGTQCLIVVMQATWEAEIRRITVWGQSRQIVWKTPISKITKSNQTRGVAQATERLFCKSEALSSNPSPTRQNKKPKTTTKNPQVLYSASCQYWNLYR
jgi:hypothetical protein